MPGLPSRPSYSSCPFGVVTSLFPAHTSCLDIFTAANTTLGCSSRTAVIRTGTTPIIAKYKTAVAHMHTTIMSETRVIVPTTTTVINPGVGLEGLVPDHVPALHIVTRSVRTMAVL